MKIKVLVSVLIILLSSCSNYDIAEKKEKPIEYKYGYNKEHDVVVISKSGKIGEILEIQGLQIALPLKPKKVYVHPKAKWAKIEYPKELNRLKKTSLLKTNNKLSGFFVNILFIQRRNNRTKINRDFIFIFKNIVCNCL